MKITSYCDMFINVTVICWNTELFSGYAVNFIPPQPTGYYDWLNLILSLTKTKPC